MTSNAIVEAKSVGVVFDDQHTAVAGVDLELRSSEFVSIVGPSGCGKSTLLKLIAGLVQPTAGEILVAGRTAVETRQSDHRVAFVFQEPNLLPWRTVAENIRLPMELHRAEADARNHAVEDSIRLIGLKPEDANKYPRMLSGGMRMRVSLARALVTNPEILLLDEPFTAIDDLMRQQLNEELMRIWLEKKWTAAFVTHNVAEAVFLSQRVLVMSEGPGRIVQEISVPFPYPRDAKLRSNSEFARLTGEVHSMLRNRKT